MPAFIENKEIRIKIDTAKKPVYSNFKDAEFYLHHYFAVATSGINERNLDTQKGI
jgi:hypothetical protein